MRFSIRDVFWLTGACALVVAWWVDRTALIESLDPQSRLAGEVFRIDRSAKRAEIALGADDGVVVGDRLDVCRNNEKVGMITLVEVALDTSLGVFAESPSRIRKGDQAILFLRQSELQNWARRGGWFR